MKYCPNCRTEYADDSLQFCLQDGSPLAAGKADQNASANYETESETLVVPKRVEPIRFEPPSSYQTNQTNQADWQPSVPVVIEREPKKTSTAAIVVMSVLGTILLLGLGGLGAWLYFRNAKQQVTVNINTAPQNRTANAANNQNANANLATPTPSATPTPQPTLNPQQTKAFTEDVKNVVDEWKDTTENLDLDGHISQYAETVDYYKAGRVGVARVRADRERAFNAYHSININIDNVKVTPDPSGDKATVILDKKWNFEGDEKYSAGKVQQQLNFSKINGRWLITAEKDLRVYYTEN